MIGILVQAGVVFICLGVMIVFFMWMDSRATKRRMSDAEYRRWIAAQIPPMKRKA